MSIITDGTTSITTTGVLSDDFLNLEQSTRKTAGGGTRTIRTGARFVIEETYRLTGTEFRSLIDLLTNGATQYYFTPSTVPDFMESTDFPLLCNIGIIKKKRHVGGGTKKYYMTVKIEGVSYI